MILWELFLSFLQVGLFSVGGGYAAIPLIQNQVVTQQGWLTLGEFTDLVTIAEMTPGPIAINAATFVGIRMEGLAGAVAATAGCILPSVILVSLLARVYTRWQQQFLFQSVLGSLRPAVVALIASAGLTILLQMVLGEGGRFQWQGALLFALGFLALRKGRWSPILVMGLCGLGGLLLGLAAG